MTAAAHGPTAGEYIKHHLTHWQNRANESLVDFSVWHYDSIFWSVFAGVLVLLLLWAIGRRATSGVPGRAQAAVEMLVEMVDTQTKNLIHNEASRRVVGPLALTVFVWVFAMNSLDFLPLDLVPNGWAWLYGKMGHDPHHAYMRIVPTADLSITMGLSVGVLLVCLFYNVKIKGLGGWVHELFYAPFGAKGFVGVLLMPFCFMLNLVEFAAKTISHGMRLFGNMFAGELIFMLIALLGGAWALSATGVGLWIAHVILGLFWTLFHVLVIPLQAFIFMMLTLVYVGQAHDAH